MSVLDIDFAREARDLKVAIEPNCYPAAGDGADIDNHALPIIETTLREIARRAAEQPRWRHDIENAAGNSFLLSVERENNGEIVRLVGEAERIPGEQQFCWANAEDPLFTRDIVSSGWTIVAWQPLPEPAPAKGSVP